MDFSGFCERLRLHPLADVVSGRAMPISALWLCPLTHFSLMRLQGEDTFAFLQNNLSSNIERLSDGTAHFAAHCTAQGRVDGCFLVFRQGENYFLRTTACLRATQMRHLQRFVLRARVSIDASEYGGIGIAGPEAVHTLEAFDIRTQNSAYSRCHIIRLPGNTPCHEIYGPTEQLAAIVDALAEHVVMVENGAWRLLNIHAGLPILYAETCAQFMPQMLNLDLLGAISFSKGCYPGQEIVARTHHLGKLKRRMFAFSTCCLPTPSIQRGTPVFVPAYSTEYPSGSVVEFCLLSETAVGLAVVRTQGIESGAFLHHRDATAMQMLALPYPLPAHSQDPENTRRR